MNANAYINYVVLAYSLTIISSYVIIAFLAAKEMINYIRKNSFVDYRTILSSPFAPSISLLAPAYNEGMTIVENVKSLLSLHYGNFEVIIINDGSKDDTIEKLTLHFELELVNFFYHPRIATKPVRGIYKSKNPAYAKLVVVDKHNGGKADAINVGINVSQNDIFACIDVDCILEHDSLLKMVKPFLEQTHERVIATGGVVRIANSCEIEEGRITQIHLPDSFLPRIQVLEYFRAFLMGRMAWGRVNGLMLISGAFGFFDKKIAIEAGGYNHKTVGEDMELVVRMRRLMEEKQEPYKVAFIPDPLCWTEAPGNSQILSRQRNRWTRGTIETLLMHKKLMFNPRYNMLGLVSFPYWFLYEWLAPFVEFFGLGIFLVSSIMVGSNWPFFFGLIALIYVFSLTFSIFAILFEELSYHQYKNKKDVLKLILTAAVEPFVFHPRVVWWALKGNYDFIRGNNTWGEMTRAGFGVAKKTAV